MEREYNTPPAFFISGSEPADPSMPGHQYLRPQTGNHGYQGALSLAILLRGLLPQDGNLQSESIRQRSLRFVWVWEHAT